MVARHLIMNRWHLVSRLYHDVLGRAEDERAAFLHDACGADEALRRDVESLLMQGPSAEGFLSGAALDVAAKVMGDPPRRLMIGTQLGSYQILSLLGTGGMGEVYRARDPKLGRDVAIKVLPPFFANDPERLARLAREARLLAALNHPHIATIHALEEAEGVPALVMELVEGPTLAERLAHGSRRTVRAGLPLADALSIGGQIAEALEAAHEKGIIHRDVKPANIKLSHDGNVKVLDFGLAKAFSSNGTASDLSHLPTITATDQAGAIVGTPAYMSPEQARGQAIDKRTDIWAFGCVLYEMLTGHAVFQGETVSDTIAAILEREPEWGALPAHVPAGIRQLLRRCLDKDPNRRLHDIADARIEIDDARSAPRAEGHVTGGSARNRERIVWLAALGFLALIAAIWAVWASRPPAPAAEMRVDIATPPTTDPASLAISPDGQKIVFAATSAGRTQLWLRSLRSDSARPLEGTDAARLPFWSPDSRSVGFFADGKLRRIDIDGGSSSVLANAPFGQGGAWNRDGAILFAPVPASPILHISATGGAPTVVTTVESPQRTGHSVPQFLPDGRHFLYYVTGTRDTRGVYISQLGGSETRRLLDADAAAVFAPSGHVLFSRRGTLFAQDFDPVQRVLTGNPFQVAERVAVDVNGASAALSASGAGPIVYRTSSADAQRQFTWFDPSGTHTGTAGTPDSAYAGPSLSLDGRRVALFKRVGENMDIFLLETERGVLTRFTVDAADDIFPIWSPDSARIVFSSTRGSSLDLYLKSVSGMGTEELLLATPAIKAASDWSRDGRFLLYSSADPTSGFDIWTLPLNGDRKPFPIVQTKSNERLAQFSPDGQWIAYESDESGRYEIYVQPFSGSVGEAGGKVPVSDKGGAQVRWQHDGKTLFYVALDDRLMAVPLGFASNGQVEPGAPVPLFLTHLRGALQPFPRYQYSVSADRRFLMLVDRENAAASPITVLLNWTGRNE